MLNNANIFSTCLKYPAFFYIVFTIQQKGMFVQARGAWITDIDDTLVESGKMPAPAAVRMLRRDSLPQCSKLMGLILSLAFLMR